MIHVFRINVEPVLLFGFEVSLPVRRNLESVEIYLRSCLKQLLTLPRNTSTSTIYILAGYLSVEALIHKRALYMSLFENVCRLPETAWCSSTATFHTQKSLLLHSCMIFVGESCEKLNEIQKAMVRNWRNQNQSPTLPLKT